MGTGVERATRVVAQLLTLARLEPDASRPKRLVIDLLRACPRATRRAHPAADEHGQDLALEADEGPTSTSRATPAAWASWMQNLVGNAVRHTPPDGCIRVLLEATPAAIALRVQDSGHGVTAGAARRFGASSAPVAGEGAGLGLAIVARIVELRGGTIALDDCASAGEVRPCRALVCRARSCRRSYTPILKTAQWGPEPGIRP